MNLTGVNSNVMMSECGDDAVAKRRRGKNRLTRSSDESIPKRGSALSVDQGGRPGLEQFVEKKLRPVSEAMKLEKK